MPRAPAALPVLPVPEGDDPSLSAAEAAVYCGIGEGRWDGYWIRFPYLVSGVRFTESVPGGRGCAKWLRTYLNAHKHLEQRRTRDAEPVRPPAQEHVQAVLRQLERVA